MIHSPASSFTPSAAEATSSASSGWSFKVLADRIRFAVPTSLAGRLMLWSLGASLFLVAVTSAVLYWGTISIVHYADDQVMEKRMQAMRLLLQDGRPDTAMIAHEVDEELEGPRQIFIRVMWPKGGLTQETQQMSKVLPVSLFPDATAAPGGTKLIGSLEMPDGRSFRTLAVRIPVGSHQNTSDGIIQVAMETTLDAEMLGWYRRLLVSVIAAAALACVLGGILMVRRELEPLRQITAATSTIGTRNLDYRLPLQGVPDELAALGEKFNEMLGRLEVSYDGLQHYADNIAHELRGPVNRILLESEVTLLKARSKAQYREAAEANIESCRQLREIVQSLLFLARADSRRTELQCERLNLENLLQGICEYYDAAAAERGISLTSSCRVAHTADLDRTLILRALGNLVSNAKAHTGQGGRIAIQAEPVDGGYEISVSDTGKGIAPEHLPHVFDRFYRADGVRTAGENGVGLGLAITKSIVELHGGTATIESALGQGTTVTLLFPRRAA